MLDQFLASEIIYPGVQITLKYNNSNSSSYPRYNGFLKTVRQAAADWFAAKGYKTDLKKRFVLDNRDEWTQNIIHPEVSPYILQRATNQRQGKNNFALHKDLHHGLSSQVMLFNLVGPLLVEGDLAPLQNLLAKKGIEWPGESACSDLEYTDRNVFHEWQGQPTSIDLVIKSRDGAPKLFIEAKFIETEFGGCSVHQRGDCDGRNPACNLSLCYLHHIGRQYWVLMQKYGLDHGKVGDDTLCILAPHYQFFRELLFALEMGGSFVLLSDERSPVFYCDGPQGQRGLMPLLLGLLPEELRKNVAAISIQELVAEIQLSGRHEWIDEFCLKYGLAPLV